jgi:hypothetical protein
MYTLTSDAGFPLHGSFARKPGAKAAKIFRKLDHGKLDSCTKLTIGHAEAE